MTSIAASLLLCIASAVQVVAAPFTVEARNDADQALAENTLQILLEAQDEWHLWLPAGEEPIHTLIAESEEAFQHYAGPMGRPNVTGIARPWKGQIVVKAPYVTLPGTDYRGTVRHELMHVLLFRNSNTDVMPRWLNEGICMMMANEYQWESSFTLARMFVESRVIPYALLDRSLQAPDSGMEFGDAYAQSLSMTRYLRDTIGDEKFWAVIAGMRELTFPDALRQYGQIEPTQFWQGYMKSLWTLAWLGALTPSSLLGLGGFLVVAAWIRRKGLDRAIFRRWEREEREEQLFGPVVVSWDEVVEDPDAWKDGVDEDEDRPGGS
ncbi:MAG: hypothetical protein GC168_00700 [Candidatus Hydrogenedens sp.]|nr:hypothetical protein [Candidatus Hydrogenedens sp.]